VDDVYQYSLSRLYAQGCFLGGWQHQQADLIYHDTSNGDLTHFNRKEWIEKAGEKVYVLVYHGGLIH
jgi:hypothetical protein